MKFTRLILTFSIVVVSIASQAQESIIVLDSNYSGVTFDAVARYSVFLKPGFRYNATGNDYFHAYIDASLPQPPLAAVDYIDPATLPVTIDQSLPVGAIPGQADVSATGAATYTIPIEVPPGTQGLQPNLSLVYNSQAGNGLMGMGWNLAGLSAITRVPKNIYNDGKVEEIKLDRTDPYALDGNRLIRVSGSAHSYDGAVYHTEMETFVQVTAKGASGNGPLWFEVKTKDGLTMEFGNTAGSRVTGANNTVIAWKINRIEDQFTNYMIFEYRTDDDEQPVSAIKYTGNLTGNIVPYNTVHFNYATRNDVTTAWPAGKEITSNLILESIEMIYENSFIRRYEFDYEYDFYSKLTSIALTGTDGEQLNPTTFKYGDSFADIFNFQANTTSIYLPDDEGQKIVGDFTGDGLSDIVLLSSGNDGIFYQKFNLYTNNGNNNFNAGNDVIFNFASMGKVLWSDYNTSDFNGDNCEDIIVFDLSSDGRELVGIEIYYSASSMPVGYYSDNEFHSINDDDNYSFITGDFDGDGRDDFLTFLHNGTLYKTKIHFPGRGNESYFISGLDGITANIADADHLNIIDYNGDGKDDLMVTIGDDSTATTIYSFEIESGVVTSNILYSKGFPTRWHKIYPGDFNGDGKTDILTTGNGYDWHIEMNNGVGFTNQPFYFLNQIDLDGSDPDKLLLADYNGDGITDIVHVHDFRRDYTSYEQIDLYYCKESQYLNKTKVETSSPLLTIVKNFYSGDFNGDGKSELINTYGYDLVQPAKVIQLNNSVQHFRLNSVSFGLDEIAEYRYKPLTDNSIYTKGSGSNYPVIDIKPPINVVFEIYSDNGVASEKNLIKYFYEGGRIHKQGKGFLGFEKVIMEDANWRIRSTSIYETEPVCFVTSLKSQFREFIDNNQPIDSAGYINAIKSYIYNGGKTYFPYRESAVSKDYLQNLSNINNWFYDVYGNLTLFSTDYNGDAEVVVTNGYSTFNPAWWCPSSRLTSTITQKSRPVEGDIANVFTEFTRYRYNNKGALIAKINNSYTPDSISEIYSDFNIYGQPDSIIILSNDLDSRITLLEYSNYGRHVAKKTLKNNFNDHITEFNYDAKTGNVSKIKDVNGLFTKYEYDGFGRLIRTEYPDGNISRNKMDWAVDGPQRYFTQQETDGQPLQRQYFDATGRTLKTGIYDFDDQMVFTETQYDSLGRVWKVSEPYYDSPSRFTEYLYYPNDGRMQSVTYPSTVIDTYTYSQESTESTVTSSNGNWKTTKTDGKGSLIMAKDAGGEINYTYFAHDGIKDILYEGRKISMTYDHRGRQTSLADPDAGTISYEYNAYGDLIKQTDARGFSYHMNYDKLGRITEKLLDSTTVVAAYTYDTAPGKGMGQLASVEGDNNITYSFEYDDLGRLKKKTENIQGRSFITETGYNSNSQVNQIKFPETGYTVGIEYQNGYIRTVNGTANIFTATGYNKRGQPTGYTLGNGLTASLGYDNYGFPTSVSIPGIRNLEYEFDTLTGNLNWRKDVAKGLQEYFTYDNLMKNRLETWQVNTGTAYGVSYAGNGNINTKTGLGMFSYNAPQPHAVSEIENTGNLVSEAEQIVRYTPFNKVDTIREGSYRLEITYGPDEARKITRLYNNNVLEKTKYFVGGNYEVEIDGSDNERRLHYIYGGDGLAAILEKISAAENLYYIHKDHLGSFAAVTNASGAKAEEMSFNPWGRRRNATNWTFDNMASAYLFDRGYTGHEHLDEFSLINMNGRVYDPILGRFMSPDNYIQVPDYTQNLNRYSYVWNNPLKYTDQDGEWVHIVVGAVVGGVVNLAMNWDNCDGFWQYAAAFGVGAGAGALTAATGGAAGAGFWATAGVAAAGSAATMGTNSVIAQTGHNFSGMGNVDWGQVGISSAIGGVSGFAGGAAGYWAANSSMLVNGISSPVLRSAVVSPLAAGTGHIAGGTTAGLIQGQGLNEAFASSFNGLGQSMAFGAAIGVASTVGVSYAKGFSPWTGKALTTNKPSWNYGDHKSQAKWENQMKQRGWTEQQINEALYSGDSYSVPNNISPNNGATRYVHPTTGRSIVIDNVTGRILHVGGDGFLY